MLSARSLRLCLNFFQILISALLVLGRMQSHVDATSVLHEYARVLPSEALSIILSSFGSSSKQCTVLTKMVDHGAHDAVVAF